MTHMDDFFEKVITVRMPEDHSCIDIIDQTLLPGEVKRVQLKTKEEIWDAIKRLQVRGAPAIGVTAAYGLALLSSEICADSFEDFYREHQKISDYLASSRPTAVNLFWALNRMKKTAEANSDKPIDDIKELLFEEAELIRNEDIEISRGIGRIGFRLMQELRNQRKDAPNGTDQPLGIMTHCNAGTLATAKYGTATAPVYTALEQGWDPGDMHVYCDETRPLLQGARLTAFELYNAGVPTTVQCDNMASALLRSGKIDIIFVGCDRVAANGDAANKIGTSGLAIIAHHYGIPMYVCAPSSTIDMATPSGDQIPIEMRAPEEVTELWYEERMAPSGVEVFNPAFDVTDHGLLSGIITERGLCVAPYEESFRKLGIG